MKEGGKSLLDAGGKMAIDLCQYSIRQLTDIRLSVQFLKKTKTTKKK